MIFVRPRTVQKSMIYAAAQRAGLICGCKLDLTVAALH
ncbi:hypothetical protein RBY4I_1186 [Rhodobacterales bacterium Y4I]|nr:hypothetical protein RBY4I_1186 [Rhodobacterales bacterium Y4I]